jgi:hypothetical protein
MKSMNIVDLMAILIIVLLAASSAQSADVSGTWNNTGTSSWDNVTNWTGGVPDGTGTATLQNGGTAQVDSSHTFGEIHLATAASTSGTIEILDGGKLETTDARTTLGQGSTAAVLKVNTGGQFISGGADAYMAYFDGNFTTITFKWRKNKFSIIYCNFPS